MTLIRGPMLGLVCLAMLLGGCAGGKYYRQGLEAERQGKVHLAYENYCKAAAAHPNSGAVVAAIKRVAPTAASYWESESLIAWSQNRHADAWRMAMRCLRIRPDHRGALQFVRKLESEHAKEIEPAKRAWLARGGRSLAKAQTVTMEAISGGVIDDLNTASAPSGEPEALALATETDPAEAAKGTSDVPNPKAATKGRKKTRKRPAKAQPRPTAVATNGTDKKPPPRVVTKAATPKKPEKDKHEKAEDGAFLAIRTLSKRNKKFERQVLAIDGITIRLRDTDSEPDADLDLYDGDRRTQKIRDLKMGRSKMFRGHTGRWFRLTVLSIHHKTETVRIGIGPA